MLMTTTDLSYNKKYFNCIFAEQAVRLHFQSWFSSRLIQKK